MKKLKIKLPYENILSVKIKNANFLFHEFIPTNRKSGIKYSIEERIPEIFSGKYYSYNTLMFFQNYLNNYFYSLVKYSFDDEIVIMNWVRYIISYILSEHFLNFHGSIIKYKGKVYFFAGSSGSGKTTISYYFMKKGGTVYSDEFALLNEGNSSFIPRPFYFRNGLLKNKKSKYSKILYGKFSKVENKREIELLPSPEKIFFLTKEKQDKYYLFLESIHKFDFFKDAY
ncbi:hypothetical protein J7L48_05270, partial [bacterium]|nr:hypothetical protein [bacterium]